MGQVKGEDRALLVTASQNKVPLMASSHVSNIRQSEAMTAFLCRLKRIEYPGLQFSADAVA